MDENNDEKAVDFLLFDTADFYRMGDGRVNIFVDLDGNPNGSLWLSAGEARALGTFLTQPSRGA